MGKTGEMKMQFGILKHRTEASKKRPIARYYKKGGCYTGSGAWGGFSRQ